MLNKLIKTDRQTIVFSTAIGLLIISTIIAGSLMQKWGYEIRQWHWENMWLIPAFIVVAFLQKKVGLPPVEGQFSRPSGRAMPWILGIIFGILDILVIKVVLHPEPYTTLPPFLQPFPYSLFLYSAGAFEVDFTYRLLPLTFLLLASSLTKKTDIRKYIMIIVGILSSLAEPLMQLPEGATWFIVYAFLSGLAMNGLQYYFLVKHGFAASYAVRLGHYLFWHNLLGIYVQFIEL